LICCNKFVYYNSGDWFVEMDNAVEAEWLIPYHHWEELKGNKM